MSAFRLLHVICPFLSKGGLSQCLQQKRGRCGCFASACPSKKAAKQRASAAACSYTLEQGFAQQSKKQRCRYWRRTSRHVNKRQVLRSHQTGGRQPNAAGHIFAGHCGRGHGACLELLFITLNEFAAHGVPFLHVLCIAPEMPGKFGNSHVSQLHLCLF